MARVDAASALAEGSKYKIGSKDWENDKAVEKIVVHLLSLVGGGGAVDPSLHAHDCFAGGVTYGEWKAEKETAERLAREEQEAATLLQSMARQRQAQKEVRAKRARAKRGKGKR